MKVIPLNRIERDLGTQVRVRICPETVERYREVIKRKKKLPPILVFFDEAADKYWPADGWHRMLAHEEAKKQEIEVEMRFGTQRDALLHALQANEEHGLPRSNEDRRNAVRMLLEDPEWKDLTVTAQAKLANVSRDLVYTVRKEMFPNEPPPEEESTEEETESLADTDDTDAEVEGSVVSPAQAQLEFVDSVVGVLQGWLEEDFMPNIRNNIQSPDAKVAWEHMDEFLKAMKRLRRHLWKKTR